MKKSYSISFLIPITLVLIFLLTTGSTVFAKEKDKDKKRIGKIVEVKGKAEIIRHGKELDAEKEKDVILKDTSKTEDESLLTIHMIEDTLVILDENTLLSFDKFRAGDKKRRGESIMFLREGWIRVKTCNNRIKVLTPLAKASAVYRTSDFEVWKTEKEGRETFCIGVVRDRNRRIAIVDFENEKGSVRVPEGYMSCIGPDGAPEDPYLIPEEIYEKILEVEGAVEWECKERCVEGEVFRKGECVGKCNECERLNPQGVCIPDNCKPCDDGNPCTVDDHCLGRKCKGKRVPSPVDPRCVE
jgi:hypothetical protein